MATFNDITEMLTMLKEDSDCPRNLREKIARMISFVNSDKEAQLKINQLQSELEDIANDINLPSFVRTQIWGVSSALETVE